MEQFHSFWNQLYNTLNFPVIKLGKVDITLWSILYFLVLIVLLIVVTSRTKKWVIDKLLSRTSLDLGVRQSIASITGYTVILVGILIILETVGIDLSALAIVAGALGIGIGFGLQNITTNFISGIIILLERPIKVGDRIEVDGTAGDVIKISLRSSTILTNDNIAVIVPNSEFISSKVINWSYRSRDVRFNFPVGVAYGTDPEFVKKLLLEVAESHPGVLKERPSDVLFDEFGESSLNFVLRVWTSIYTSRPGVLKSELYYMIAKKFAENDIEIPFPQRDIHIRSSNANFET
jgi:small-conductance mechanosensitive channel